MVGTVVKANIGELEEEVRVGSARRMRMELTGVVQAISGKGRFLVRFHDGCEKNLSSNQYLHSDEIGRASLEKCFRGQWRRCGQEGIATC